MEDKTGWKIASGNITKFGVGVWNEAEDNQNVCQEKLAFITMIQQTPRHSTHGHCWMDNINLIMYSANKYENI